MSADGVLYFAEAGRGSDGHCDPSGQNCVGLTGSIDMLGAHGVTRVVTGLISIAGQGGIGAEGMVAVSTSGGNVYGQFGANTYGIPPSGFPKFLVDAARKELGQLGQVSGSGFVEQAPVGDVDYRWANQHRSLNPQFPDSNPNGVLAIGGVRYVADAGANTLDAVGADGKVHVLTYFDVPAKSPTDAVPTCVAQGPDGALYVGELLGGNFAPGHARVWRVAIKNGKVTKKSVWATGLTTVQGCGFDRAGNFYATEFETHGLSEGPSGNPAGAVVKIAPNGSRTVIGAGKLFVPSGFAARADGTIYVSNCSIAPSTGFGPCTNGGEIVRIK